MQSCHAPIIQSALFTFLFPGMIPKVLFIAYKSFRIAEDQSSVMACFCHMNLQVGRLPTVATF